MGRLTEILYCATHLAAEINREQLSRLDLDDPVTNEQIKELRKQAKKNEKLLWD